MLLVKVSVSGLNWGSYYWIETASPAGYLLNPNKIEFSVGFGNAYSTLTNTTYDTPDERTLTITKRILKANVNWGNGEPSFTWRITGTTTKSESVAYNMWVNFTQSSPVDGSGYYYLSTSMTIPAGTYKVVEELTQRYELEGITGTTNCTISGANATVDLRSADASLTYVNRVTRYDHPTHSSATVNEIPAPVTN